MRFKTCFGNLGLIGVAAWRSLGFAIHRFYGTASDAKKVKHAKILQEVCDASIGIAQLNGTVVVRLLVGIQPQAKAGEDAKERAVHQRAFGKLQDEVVATLCSELADQG